METLQVKLSEKNSARASELALSTGKTPDQLVNEAFDRFASQNERAEHQKFLAWQQAARRVAGIWQDRDDLPDFEEVRKSWDRDVWNRE